MSDQFLILSCLIVVFLGVVFWLIKSYKTKEKSHQLHIQNLQKELADNKEKFHQEQVSAMQDFQATLQKRHDDIINLETKISQLKDNFHQETIKQSNHHQQLLTQKQQTIAQLQNDLIQQEADFKTHLDKAIKDAQKRSNDIQRNVIKGQVSEKFVPFMAGFTYNPSDCRFLGEPIDYVIFNNLHHCADGQMDISELQIIFVEVKSGNAKLNKRQQILQHAINNHQVSFEILRIDESHEMPFVYPEPNKNTPINAGAKWTPQEETALLQAFDDGMSIQELSAKHGRSEGGIRSRLVKLGRLDE